MATKEKISVLIVDGMNNHDWKRITTNITTILLHTGMFFGGGLYQSIQ